MRTSHFTAVMIMGRLTGDPRLEYTPDGIPVCRFTVAIVRRSTRADGSRAESKASVEVTAQRRLAEICAQFLRSGREVFVAGTLEEARSRDRRGAPAPRLRIAADTVQFLNAASTLHLKASV